MSITTIFDFSNPSNYILNNIGVTGSIASLNLISNPNPVLFTQPFTSSSGFTYDSAKTEFVAGVLRQLDVRPAGSTFYAKFDSSLNASWSNGDGTGTPANGAAINNGMLDLTGGGNKNITFAGLNNASTAVSKGAVRFRVTPNYDGVPTGNQVFFTIGKAVDDNTNRIQLLHLNNGNLFLIMNDDNGVALVTNTLTNFSATAGVSGDFEMNWDFDQGKIWVLGSGFLFSEIDIAVTRSNDIGFIQFGSSDVGQDFSIDHVAIFDEVQHTTNYTPAFDLPDTIYAADTITAPTFSYPGLGDIQAFVSATITDANSARYTLNGRYWNGSSWAVSNDSYAQANPASTVIAQIAQLPVSNTVVLKIYTTDQNLQASVDNLTAGYTGQIYPMSGGTALSNSGITAEDIVSFSSINNVSGSDSVTFALKVNNVLMYWNGSAWVASNGTLSQTNSAAVISAHGTTLLTVNSNVKLYTLLVSNTGATTPSLTSMTIAYDFGQIAPSAPTTAIVYGFLSDVQGSPVPGAQVTFALVNTVANAYMGGAGYVLVGSAVTVTTDANGYFEQSLLATTQFEGTNTFIKVSIQSGSSLENVTAARAPLYIAVPAQASVDITTLLTG